MSPLGGLRQGTLFLSRILANLQDRNDNTHLPHKSCGKDNKKIIYVEHFEDPPHVVVVVVIISRTSIFECVSGCEDQPVSTSATQQPETPLHSNSTQQLTPLRSSLPESVFWHSNACRQTDRRTDRQTRAKLIELPSFPPFLSWQVR